MKDACLVILAVVVSLLATGPLVHAGEAAGMCNFDRFAELVKPTPKQRKGMERVLAETDKKLTAWDDANDSRQSKIEAELRKVSEPRMMTLDVEARTHG